MNVYVIHMSNGFGFERVGSVRASNALEAAELWEAISGDSRIAMAVKVRA